MAPLTAWAASKAALVTIAESVDPVNDKSAALCGDADRTICAVRGIAEGDVLVTLREGAYLNGTTWLAELQRTAKEDADRLQQEIETTQPSPTVLTVLALLNEKSKGEASAFHGYLQQLPSRVAVPMTWTAESRALLKDTAASPIVDFELVQSLFQRYLSPLAASFSELWPASVASLTEFIWAYSVISSRAFAINDRQEPTLLPVIDMANHDPTDSNAIIQRTPEGNYTLSATRAIASDEAVTISYGELSNAQLLCRYGFVLPTTVPTDSILITSTAVRTVYAHVSAGGSVESALQELEKQAHATTTTDSPPTKRRKLFEPSPADSDDTLVFALHGNPAEAFGISDTLLSFVFANNLSAELLYDVLSVLLQHKDKQYSELLAELVKSDGSDEARGLVQALVTHERQVSRRVLVGIMTLEEDSDDEEEFNGDEEGENEEEDDEE
ncbi:hypothetical protein Poli38472_006388 [Pythium oligandrum]|uniref:SET domain-containing protein n=1 Tax=Pythium oligandrum TaxID=41045 RepID=A0A8K1C4W9_PYTOL|nr:hypothetical protein Poli38472_006388 [Pythium oligandrum]|eukprot:TMW56378.1 hypothetical protein Poli38472_006388 [Pythium oligandrum]